LIAQGVKAGDIANAIATTTGGKGGGRPHFASAGIGDVAKMRDARNQTPRIVRELLKR
jgi:alanyl-tRNA synthetase